MSAAFRFLAVLLFSAGAMFGQEQNALRVTAPERAVQMRVQVLYPGGAALYDSDWKGGNILDLSGLPIGSYELRIFSRDLDGTLSQKETTLQVSPDRITIDPPLPEDLKLTTTAHDGITGQIITTSGDLSFRFGDYLNHRDTEAMRLSPEGNLEVKGWIRAGQGILFSDGTVVDSKKKFKAKADASGTGTQNQIAKWIDSAGTLGDAAVSEVGGNVGIGTSTPGGKLHIFGAANSDIYAGLGVDMNAGPSFNIGYGGASFGRSAGFFNVRPDASATPPNPSLRFMTANSERMIITNAGNIGIGTSTPGGKLQVFAAPTADVYAGFGTDMSAGPSLNFGYGGATFGRGAGFFNARPDPSATAPNPSLRFMTANAERMIITNAGNVGIGTSSPTEKLEINGNLALPLTSSASAGVITMGGNSVFHLFGTGDTFVGRFAGNFATTGNNNTGLGGGALESITTGSADVAIGSFTLQLNTTGFNNTALGSGTLQSNTTGNNNTGTGKSTLTLNTTGSRNVAVGESALFSNTTGSGNIAVGEAAGENLTTGDNNIDIGNSGIAAEANTIRIGIAATHTRTFLVGTVTLSDKLELPATTSAGSGAITQNGDRLLHTFGTQNLFIGRLAGNFTMTGSNNTAAGSGALNSNTTGFSNTAVGSGTLSLNTTGNSNVAVGPSALTSNTSGFANIAIGDTALFTNTVSGGNVAVGNFALQNNTGGGNVAIGGGAGGNLTTGDENIDIRNNGVAGEFGTIRIGTSPFQSRAFIAGIRDVTTGAADALTVVIDSNGQLGTVSSSASVKRNIETIAEASSALLKLRPVSFFYRNDAIGIRQYGLIAEEVAAVMPELVQFSSSGKPETVRYHFLPPLLLRELQKQQQTIDDQRKQIAMLEARLTALEERSRTTGSPRE